MTRWICAALLLGLACAGAPGPTPTTTSTSTSTGQPPTPTPTPTPANGPIPATGPAPTPTTAAATPPTPGEPRTARLSTPDHRTRTWREIWPASPEAAADPVPVLIALHGGGGSGEGFAASDGLEALVPPLGIAVVHPDGTARTRLAAGRMLTWDAGRCCAREGEPPVDDVGFLVALVDELAQTHPIDRRRVVLLGHSNGAMMAERALCERPDVFAGAVLVGSPGIGPGVCAPKEPRPVVVVHGIADRCATLKPTESCGGCFERALRRATGLALPPRALACEGMDGIAARWSAADPAGQETFSAGPATCTTRGSVTTCTHPGGHAFPGAGPPCAGGPLCDAIVAETGPVVTGVDLRALIEPLIR